MGSLYENRERLLRELENARSCCLTEHELCERLGCSRATFFRALTALREDSKIELRPGGGYRLIADKESFHGILPQELESLAVFWRMFEGIQKPLSEPYETLKAAFLRHLRNLGIPFEAWQDRIRYLLPHQRREVTPVTFGKISDALLHHKVIRFRFRKYGKAEPEMREVHSQQFVFYRNGWSLAALDESRVGREGADDIGLRQFPLDLISGVRITGKPWKEVNPSQLKRRFASGYGLYAGEADSVARIHFSGVAAFYVQREQWHPEEKKEIFADGNLRLSVPYVSAHPEELIGDILRWGNEAFVEEPPELKERVREKIRRMAEKYREGEKL